MEDDFIREWVPVMDVLIDNKNPRFPETDNQVQAIERMVKDQGQKIFSLARSILDDGLNPSDPPILHKDSESKIYTVLEGNRRFTALKLLENPLLAECRPKIVQQFKKLQQRYLENPYKTVFCVVYNDRSLANRWIELKHTNDNKGVGTERWRPLQQGRFNQNSLGLKQEITAQVLDIIYENDDFPDDLREQLEDVPFTNLKRLLSNSQARTLMGFTLQNKEISISKSGKVVSRIMEEIIRDLLPNPMSLGKKANIVVSDIYSSEAAVEYINQVLGRLIDTEYLPEEKDSTKDTAYSEEPFANNVSNTPNDNLSEFNEEQKGNSEEYEPKPRGIRPQNRKKLRTRGEQLLPITVPKIATLYQELIGITMCEPIKTLVSIGMRSLIEMSCTNYIRAHSKGKPSVRISDNLIKTRQLLESEYPDHKHLYKFIMADLNDDVHDIVLLNGYVHDSVQTPSVETLFVIWDRFAPVLYDMWVKISLKSTKGKR